MAKLRQRVGGFIPWAVLVILILVLPDLTRPTVATEVWVFAVLALAFNLLLGYTGLLSFGQATFFGTGAYTAGLLLIHQRVHPLAALAAAALAGGLVAAVIGYLCIRRIGLYFIMLTFAFNLMAYFIVYQASSITGGVDGLPGVPRPPVNLYVLTWDIRSGIAYYLFVSLIFLLCAIALKKVVDSPFGLVLQAIRENEARAAALGYNTAAFKRVAFIISGAFSGLAGALYGMLFGIVPIDTIYWVTSGNVVFMTLIGGTTSFFGPIVGAVFFIWLAETVSVRWERWPLIVGLVFVFVIFFFRGGFVEVWHRAYGLLARLTQRGQPKYGHSKD